MVGVAADAYDCGCSLTRVSPCEDLGLLCSDDLVLMSLITLTASLPISLASLFSVVTLLTNTTLSRNFTKIFPSIVHVSVTDFSFLSCRARYAMSLRNFVRSSFMLTERYSGLSFKFFLHFNIRDFNKGRHPAICRRFKRVKSPVRLLETKIFFIK